MRKGDLVLHLRDKGKKAAFVGWSTAASDGEETHARPPTPGTSWEYAQKFFRAALYDHVPLATPVALKGVFERNREQLYEYFQRNKRRKDHLRLFYVWQSHRLQCLNGAYLSELDEELVAILLDGVQLPAGEPAVATGGVERVTTGSQVRELAVRIGQNKFSQHVKSNYGYRCCFPECEITGSEFLIAGHIARWADKPELRGEVSNGLSLCLLHDKAFELGLFTLTLDGRVWISHAKCAQYHWAPNYFVGAEGQKIFGGKVPPSREAIEAHWKRHKLNPLRKGHGGD